MIKELDKKTFCDAIEKMHTYRRYEIKLGKIQEAIDDIIDSFFAYIKNSFHTDDTNKKGYAMKDILYFFYELDCGNKNPAIIEEDEYELKDVHSIEELYDYLVNQYDSDIA